MALYPQLTYPSAPPDRPYIFINMVSTIDGKIITGEQDDPVQDLGSRLDHATMKVIEASADAVINGASTIRATPRMNFPEHLIRYCVTESGKIDPSHSFFLAGRSWLIRPEEAPPLSFAMPELRAGRDLIDWHTILRTIRHEHGVEKLLCEGGAELNASLFALDLIDEIFWTVAPKIKLGRDVPTIAGGMPLPRNGILNFDLVSCQPVEDEIFLRYQRHRPVA